MTWVVELDGDKRVIDKLENINGLITGFSAPLKATGDLLIQEYQDNFEAEGSRVGSKWQALAESTRIQKARLGYGNKPILVRTGELMRGFLKEVSRYQVRVHNPIRYFRYHQLGEGNNPKRPMILLPERLKQDIIEIFNKAIRAVINK